MSAAQASGLDEYFVLEHRNTIGSHAFPFSVYRWDISGPALIDLYRTRSGANHAARLLNRGVASVDSHALFGCRVRTC